MTLLEELNRPQEGWKNQMPVLIASNRLPVKLYRDARANDDGSTTLAWRAEWAGDRVIEAQNSFSHHELAERTNIKFIGRIPEWEIESPDDQAQVEAVLKPFNCFPVFVPKQEAKLYYEDYCKQTLWPTFHNVIDLYSPVDVFLNNEDGSPASASSNSWTPESQKLAWQAYANVNQSFSNVRLPY